MAHHSLTGDSAWASSWGIAPYREVLGARALVALCCDVLGFEIVANSPPRDEALLHSALLPAKIEKY